MAAVSNETKRRSSSEIVVCDERNNNNNKRVKLELLEVNNNSSDDDVHVAIPVGFHDPSRKFVDKNNVRRLSKNNKSNGRTKTASPPSSALVVPTKSCKQFWKAGDYEGVSIGDHPSFSNGTTGMDHARVHPKFLHSNATSHKWSLGAFAELLDNALDEVCNGATYVNVDMLRNKKDGETMFMEDKDCSKMLLVQDDGGGMRPDKMRNCMSLGYSSKSKMANTIGQYGNGFKTSTMRLGADVIVFSSCKAKDGMCPTRSIGMLSYTFLKSTKKEDTVVPMIDYEKKGDVWTKIVRSSINDWNLNLDTITEWSPYSSEQELLQQFNHIDNQGTRIIIYNLWEDDMQQLELDFDTDPHDIQIRGVNRDEKKIAMAKKYPNSRHFLTYQHSLRSYASILYLRLPHGFRIILRGKDVEHHNLANDMAYAKEVQYRPAPITDGTVKDSHVTSKNIQVLVTIGFVKDAEDHIDIQGFNVYHKNRLIKPFWRVWNAAGSDGRGVIGLLEADFVEPAHDKQGFEKTTALSRLEQRLIVLQKAYWRDNCHMIGYAPRRALNKTASGTVIPISINSYTPNGKADKDDLSVAAMTSSQLQTPPSEPQSHSNTKFSRSEGNDTVQISQSEKTNVKLNTSRPIKDNGGLNTFQSGENDIQAAILVAKLSKENFELKKRVHDANCLDKVDDLQRQVELGIEKCKSLETKLEDANRKIADMDKEQESLIEIFAEERERRDIEEEKLRKRLRDASRMIDELLERVKESEKSNGNCKTERQ